MGSGAYLFYLFIMMIYFVYVIDLLQAVCVCARASAGRRVSACARGRGPMRDRYTHTCLHV